MKTQKSNKLIIIIMIFALIVAALLGLRFCEKNDKAGNTEKNNSTPAINSADNSKADNSKADNSEAKEPILFKDPVFEKLLKQELGKDKVYLSDLSDISGVEIVADQFIYLSGPNRSNKSIIFYGEDTFEYDGKKYTGFGTMKSLEDLKHFPMITALRVSLQPELDYSIIPYIDRLYHIAIYHSKLSEVNFLSGAINLTTLILDSNNITDISSIKNMLKLKLISVNYNKCNDISVLKNLTVLEQISFYSNGITDITPLANLKSLKKIGMYENKVADISILANLSNLTYVEFINNKITDVSPLKEFKSFKRLALKGNPIKNIGVLSHIENLEYE